MTTNLRGFWKDGTTSQRYRPKVVIQPKKKRKDRKKEKRRKDGLSQRDKAKLKEQGVTGLGAPHPDYRYDDRFYRSTAWRQLRYLALKNCDGRCQCCGARAADGASLHVDHIVPRYKAPHLSLDLGNLQCLCQDCNVGKGAWDDTDWREHMKSI